MRCSPSKKGTLFVLVVSIFLILIVFFIKIKVFHEHSYDPDMTNELGPKSDMVSFVRKAESIFIRRVDCPTLAPEQACPTCKCEKYVHKNTDDGHTTDKQRAELLRAGEESSEDHSEQKASARASEIATDGVATLREIYPISEFNIDVQSEVEYLRNQVDIFAQKELAMLVSQGLLDGMTVIDAGCGPGWLAQTILHHLPSSKVFCIDGNKQLLEQATKINEDLVREDRLVPIHAAVENLPFDSFGLKTRGADFIICRFVLQHLATATMSLVLRQLHKALKTGGKLVVITSSSISDTVLPVIPSLMKILGAYNTWKEEKMQQADPNEEQTSRTIPHELTEAGFGLVAAESLVAHSAFSETGIDSFLPLIHPKQYYGVLRAERVSQADYDNAVKDFDVEVQRNRNAFLMVTYADVYVAERRV